MTRALHHACIALALAGASRSATAQPLASGAGAPSPACAQAARDTAEADAYLADGVFEPAIAGYEEALARCPEPGFRAQVLFDLGVAHMRRAEATVSALAANAQDERLDPEGTLEATLAGRREAADDRRQALQHLRACMRMVTDPRLASDARVRVVRLERELAADQVAIEKTSARLTRLRPSRRAPADEPPAAGGRSIWWQLGGGAVVVGGVGLLGAGAYEGWHAHTLARELSAATEWKAAQRAADADRAQSRRRAIAFTAGGGAAIVVAAALLWYGRAGNDEPRRLTAIITGRGVAVAGSF